MPGWLLTFSIQILDHALEHHVDDGVVGLPALEEFQVGFGFTLDKNSKVLV